MKSGSLTLFKSQRVAPIRPQPPGTGARTSGAISQNVSCASASNMKFTSRPSPASVAKIRRGVLNATRLKWGASLTLSKRRSSLRARAAERPTAEGYTPESVALTPAGVTPAQSAAVKVESLTLNSSTRPRGPRHNGADSSGLDEVVQDDDGCITLCAAPPPADCTVTPVVVEAAKVATSARGACSVPQ